MRKIAIAGLVGCLAGGAIAQPLTTKQAQAQLFGTRGTAVAVSSALSATDQAIVTKTIELLGEQLGGPVKYYAAMAYAPDEGLVSESFQSAINYHSIASADAAALGACDAAKASGSGACRIAARIVPRGYEPRAVTLSFDASNAFAKTYRRAASPKALAASDGSGAWAIGKSAADAVAACGGGDCRVVVQD